MKFLLPVILVLAAVSCNESPYMQGKRLYTARCANCHMEDGSGLSKLIPSLTVSTLLGDPSMACLIAHGLRDTIYRDSVYLPREMPAFSGLSSTEVTNIINFINHKWHKPFRETTILEVEEALKNCP